VLTKGVFNVFLADEIDAAMSEERANEVQTALYRIKDKVKQIVLVSHKPNLEPVDERIEV
jgi:ABC-type lipoprotein export system ATPase subunit